MKLTYSTQDAPQSMRSFFKEILPPLEKFGLRPKQARLWSSTRYFKEKPNDLAAEQHLINTNQLRADLVSFFDEYAALKARVSYQYQATGIRGGYIESMSHIAANFVKQLAEQNRPTARAELELAVAQFVEKWMKDEKVAVGEKLVVISPRGMKEEGYPGLNPNNYCFGNIFIKTADGFELRQYRNYELNQDLPSLQQNLVQLGGYQFSALSEEGIDPVEAKFSGRVDLTTIDTVIVLPPELGIDAVTNVLFANQAQWPIDIDQDLPQLDAEAYQQQLSRIENFCVQQFTKLTFDNSIDKTTQFDLLIDLSRQAFLKWVEDHALNYEHKEKHRYNVDLVQLETVWQAQLQKEAGQQLSKEAKQQIKSFTNLTALNPALPLNQAASWAHCIAGTPFSIINNPNLMQALQMNNLTMNQLAEVVGKDRAKLWKDGVCQSCGDHTLVGECSICLSCEIKLGHQSQLDQFSEIQDDLSSGFSGEDKVKAEAMIKTISTALLRQSVSIYQWLADDVISPDAEIGEWQDIAERVKSSSAPLRELEVVVFELTNNGNKPPESGKKFLFPVAEKQDQQRAA